jgi:hypothetical protein
MVGDIKKKTATLHTIAFSSLTSPLLLSRKQEGMSARTGKGAGNGLASGNI